MYYRSLNMRHILLLVTIQNRCIITLFACFWTIWGCYYFIIWLYYLQCFLFLLAMPFNLGPAYIADKPSRYTWNLDKQAETMLIWDGAAYTQCGGTNSVAISHNWLKIMFCHPLNSYSPKCRQWSSLSSPYNVQTSNLVSCNVNNKYTRITVLPDKKW